MWQMDTSSNTTPVFTKATQSFFHRLRNYFLTGLIVAGPLAITASLIWWLIKTVDGWVKPLIPARFYLSSYLPFEIPGLGLAIALIVLTFLGFLTANIAGKSLLLMGERLLGRMPVVRGIYKAFKQVFEMVFSSSSNSFKKAGLVEYPHKGNWSVVLISSEAAKQIQEKSGEKETLVGVFLPCAPNPTTGFFFYIPRSQIIELDISVDEAFKLVVSAGLIQPSEQKADLKPKPSKKTKA